MCSNVDTDSTLHDIPEMLTYQDISKVLKKNIIVKIFSIYCAMLNRFYNVVPTNFNDLKTAVVHR